MLFLPVLDIQNGVVVRAIGGRRSEYRSLVSRLTDSTEPLAVAKAIRARFGWTDFYVADLDSITASFAPDFALHDQLRTCGFHLWVDAGVRTADDADRLADAGIERVVVGLETIRGPAEWRAIIQRLGPERAVFSLDMRDGTPVTTWSATDALGIADRIIADGGTQLIVLDLARVGSGHGPGTEALCAELTRRHPKLAVYAGGGFRGGEDLRRFELSGVTGVLLASALHEGTFAAS